MLTIFLLLLLVAALGGGLYGFSRWGYVGLSPSAVVLVLLAVLFFTGDFQLR